MGKITIDELHDSLFDYVQAVSDDKLETNNKTIVGAINELFSNNVDKDISNGKQLIADAIGEPLNAEDSFNEMSNDINGLLSQFKVNMMNNGITVESGDKFKQLIDKIKELTEAGSKGIQLAMGEGDWKNDEYGDTTIPINIDFEPTYIFCLCKSIQSWERGYSQYSAGNMFLSNITEDGGGPAGDFIKIKYTGTEIVVDGYKSDGKYCVANITAWYAIGIGEEDTTLRDSLADILENKGVEVSDEDDMASLITKVDSIKIDNTDIFWIYKDGNNVDGLYRYDNITPDEYQVISCNNSSTSYDITLINTTKGSLNVMITHDSVIDFSEYTSVTVELSYMNAARTNNGLAFMFLSEDDLLNNTMNDYVNIIYFDDSSNFTDAIKGFRIDVSSINKRGKIVINPYVGNGNSSSQYVYAKITRLFLDK